MDISKTSTWTTGQGYDQGLGKGYDQGYGQGKGKGGWGILIVIIIIIIIILLICWWFWCGNDSKDFDGCDHLAGSKWQGDGHYSGTKGNANLQDNCHREWIDLVFTRACGKCVGVKVNFKILSGKGCKPETRATGTFDAVGTIDCHGVAHLTSTQGEGEMELRISDECIDYRFTEFNGVKGTGEKGVTVAKLWRVKKQKHDY
jgi:hypothetical protein